ncbi:MAG: rhomboid family intramembrane serine protease [Candidatus Eisenbacteria bacterium]|nr:rhomboid family intramembrane serine protease [Candidatus Eisenbacteria bacterium]
MIPLRDHDPPAVPLRRARRDNPSATVPFVSRALIALSAAVFLYQALLGPDLRAFVYGWGLVPVRLTLALRFHEEPVAAAGLTLLTSMFLHGGWSHLIGNMWYLWIFGDNVEDRLGHVRFLLFYLASGVVAGLLHFLTHSASELPTVGASGAIAGVLGAYTVAFPRARVVTLIPLFPFFQIVALPAFLVLGLWFVLQFVLGLGALGGSTGGGIAWWAHIGGFAFGWLAMRLLGGSRRSQAWVR